MPSAPVCKEFLESKPDEPRLRAVQQRLLAMEKRGELL